VSTQGQWKGVISVLGAATFWGLSATWAQFLQRHGVSTLLIVQTRVTVAFLLLVALFAVTRREVLRIRPSDWWRFLLLGVVGIAGANFTYYFTMKVSTVATAILLQYLAPLAVVGYGLVSKEEQLSPRTIVAAVVSLGGCFLAVGGAGDSAVALSPVALGMGLLAMATFAFMTVSSRHLLARYSSWTVVVYGLAFAALLWLIVRPPTDLAAETHGLPVWLALVGLSLTSVLFPYLLYFGGLRRISASRTIITSTMEPIVAILSAALLLGETLDGWRSLGAAAVVIAIVVVQRAPASPLTPSGASDAA
jgi:drug/metabolite transporter (DMT)-like permease